MRPRWDSDIGGICVQWAPTDVAFALLWNPVEITPLPPGFPRPHPIPTRLVLPPEGLPDTRGAVGYLSPELCPVSHSWCQHPDRLLLLLRLPADPAQISGRLLCDQQPVLQARSHVRASLPARPGEGAWGSDAPPWSSGHQGGPCCVFSPGLGPAEGPGGLPLGRGRRGKG